MHKMPELSRCEGGLLIASEDEETSALSPEIDQFTCSRSQETAVPLQDQLYPIRALVRHSQSAVLPPRRCAPLDTR